MEDDDEEEDELFELELVQFRISQSCQYAGI
jgi:hypothetical protein